MLLAMNMFGRAGPPKRISDSYNVSHRTKSYSEINAHFPLSYDHLSLMTAKDNDLLSSSATINTMNVWHRSKLQWPQFVDETALSVLRENNISIFAQFQKYQHQFTSNIYAPLLLYKLSNNAQLFEGDANDLLLQLMAVYNHLQSLNLAPECCIQIDVRLTPDVKSGLPEQNKDNNDSDGSDDDDDDDYHQMLDKMSNLPLKQPSHRNDNYRSSNLAKSAAMQKHDISVGIGNILRQSIPKLDIKPYSYKRYEVVFHLADNTNDICHVTTFEAISNSTTPHCSFKNIPLCRIFNSTNSTQEILQYLNPDGLKKNLLTFSFHRLNDCIHLYAHIAVDGKLYGSRIFKEDLFNIIPSLFENKTIDDHTKEELNNNLNFNVDQAFNEYKGELLRHSIHDLIPVNESNHQFEQHQDDIESQQILFNDPKVHKLFYQQQMMNSRHLLTEEKIDSLTEPVSDGDGDGDESSSAAGYLGDIMVQNMALFNQNDASICNSDSDIHDDPSETVSLQSAESGRSIQTDWGSDSDPDNDQQRGQNNDTPTGYRWKWEMNSSVTNAYNRWLYNWLQAYAVLYIYIIFKVTNYRTK